MPLQLTETSNPAKHNAARAFPRFFFSNSSGDWLTILALKKHRDLDFFTFAVEGARAKEYHLSKG